MRAFFCILSLFPAISAVGCQSTPAEDSCRKYVDACTPEAGSSPSMPAISCASLDEKPCGDEMGRVLACFAAANRCGPVTVCGSAVNPDAELPPPGCCALYQDFENCMTRAGR